MPSAIIPGLNDDTMKFILTWIRGGPWHTVCRLCCRSWTQFLTPVPLQRPFGPFEEAVLACNLHTLQWLLTQGVPWSCEAALSACTFQGRLDALRWTVQHAPVCVRSLSHNERIRITRNLLRAGPLKLGEWHAAIRSDTTVAAILCFTPVVLAFAVRLYGTGKLYDAESWQSHMELCIDLCGGWAIEALYAAVRHAEVAVVEFFLLHPDAVFQGRSGPFITALSHCVLRKQPDGPKVWDLILGMAPDHAELPWCVLETAVRQGQFWPVHAFLADPRCPEQRSGPGPDGVVMAVVQLAKPDAVVIELLQVMAAAGIRWDTEDVWYAAVDRPVKPTLLQWMLQNGGEDLPEPTMVLLRCILAGCAENLRTLLPYLVGTVDRSNPMYTMAAAEMGFLDVLQCLRESEYHWDHKCLHMALTNNHTATAKWALTHGCPILTRPITPGTGDEEELRATLMGVM